MNNHLKEYIKLILNEGRINDNKINFLVKKYLPRFLNIYQSDKYQYIDKDLNLTYPGHSQAGDNPEEILRQFIKFVAENIDPSNASDYTEWVVKNFIKDDGEPIHSILGIKSYLKIHNIIKKIPRHKIQFEFNPDINFYESFDDLSDFIPVIRELYDIMKIGYDLDGVLKILPVIRHKYVVILWNTLKNYTKSRFEEDKNRFTDAFDTFEELGGYKYGDVYSYTIYDVENFNDEEAPIDSSKENIIETKKNIKNNLKEGVDYVILLDDGIEFLIHLLSPRASCTAGMKTKWCISQSRSDGSPTDSSSKYFNRYNANTFVLFYINQNTKYMISLPKIFNFDDMQFMDIKDQPIIVPFSSNALGSIYLLYHNNGYDADYVVEMFEEYKFQIDDIGEFGETTYVNVMQILRQAVGDY
jgi:hypothetical protein